MPGVRLEWDGKGAEVPRLHLPLQVVETVNAPRADRGTLFEGGASDAAEDGWRNQLIWGDNLHVLATLADRYAGQVDLVYIDPPFDSRQDYKVRIAVGDENAAADQDLAKISSVIEEKAYRDTWGKGVESYLQMLYQRLVLLRELLSERGSLLVHCDWHASHLIRLVLDDVFGSDNFVNSVAWHYFGFKRSTARNFPRKHDDLLLYAKNSANRLWTVQYKPHRPEYIARFKAEPGTGRLYRDDVNPTGGGSRLIYLDEVPGDIVDDVWDDIPPVNSQGQERAGYDTQKPEALLERIIKSSSDEGSIVLDCFVGSGTTAAVAERLNRRWIAVDIGRFAIHTTRKRLLDIKGCKPFVVGNLGRYERQVWQQATTGEQLRAYLDFVVDLYHAKPVSDARHVHGQQGARAVHIGSVEAPVGAQEIVDAADEAKDFGYQALDVLGWEFDLGLHELVQDEARARGIELRLRRIPREVMDPRVIAAGEVVFHELAYVKVDAIAKNRSVAVTLHDFILANADELVPPAVRDKIGNWSDYVDYWAVDFTYGTTQGDTFHNQWQSYRTRAARSLELSAQHDYAAPGHYAILVKVIDIFGNDTTARVEVDIR